MVNERLLKAAMLEAGYNNIKDASKAAGIKASTMYRKLHDGGFTLTEVKQMIEAFCIPENKVRDIFFAQ